MCIADIVGGWLSARSTAVPAAAPSQHPAAPESALFCSARADFGAPRESGAAAHTRPPRWGFVGCRQRHQPQSQGEPGQPRCNVRLWVTRSATTACFAKNDCRHQLFCGHTCVKKYQAVSCSFGVLPFLFPSPEV